MPNSSVYERWETPEKPKKRVIQEIFHDSAPNYDTEEGSDLYDNNENVKKPL